MPPADTVTGGAAPAGTPATVHGWGGGDPALVTLLAPDDLEAAQAVVASDSYPGMIARGMGRSYGDAAQLAGGVVLDTTALKDIRFDREGGLVTAQAGVTIGELLDVVVPAGWALPVVPGTQHVTVGGAIASDIHGKSHSVDGTFGSHVRAIGLLTAAGELLELEPADELFGATLGGMGLTGVIVWARIALRQISSPLLSVDTDRAATLDDALALLSGPGGRYRVAWVDLLGARHGRAVVTRADHIPADSANGAASAIGPRGAATVGARATVPRSWPGGLLAPSTVRAFNELRYRTSPRRERDRPEPFGAHMFPLDVLDAWPRLYGPLGFVQYQLAVPPGGVNVLHDAIATLRARRVPCYLAVLKDFGPANAAPLSFPIEGWTLTLDIPRRAPGLDAALDRLDEIVAHAGGRVYLTKDARMQPSTVQAMYPRLGEWQAIRERADPEGLWRSDLATRTGLVAR
jgi:decaprenylphospho-beta-D-ribofuranose 2-oxidase